MLIYDGFDIKLPILKSNLITAVFSLTAVYMYIVAN